MNQLTSESVIQAVVAHVQENIPTVDIRKWVGNGKQHMVEHELKVFNDADGYDPNDETNYPFMFVSNYDLSRRVVNPGGKDKFYFNHYFELRYHVDIRPADVKRVPRLNEELRAMIRKLMIVFDRVEILGDTYRVEITPSFVIHEGVLSFFILIRDVPEYVFSDPVPTVEEHGLGIELEVPKP